MSQPGEYNAFIGGNMKPAQFLDVLQEANARPYWMVHRVGKRGPSHIHFSYDAAFAEAERLARSHPRSPVVVLRAEWATIAYSSDGTPFGFNADYALAMRQQALPGARDA